MAKKPKPTKPPKSIPTIYRSGKSGSGRSYAKKSEGASYRSAKTGRYVTKKYAQRHPSTTIKESRKRK